MTASGVVEVVRRIAAVPSRVFAHLTESADWARWQGADATIEAHVGGMFRMRMGNGMIARGQFTHIEPHERLVFTWGWVDHPGLPPGSSTVEIQLVPDGDGTVLTLTHSGLPDDEVSMHAEGWNHLIPRLATFAEGGDPDAVNKY